MIVDIHTHIFPDELAARTVGKLRAMSHTFAFTDGTADALRRSMARAGVDAALVLPVATNPKQVPHVNDASIALNDRGAETGVYSFGCMHPDFPDWRAELARLSEAGVRGIKLHPTYQGVDFDDARYLRLLDRCAELGLIVYTHAGLDVGFPGVDRVSPEMIARAVRQTDGATLFCAHMGGWRQWDAVERLLPETGVCIDTSFSLGELVPDDGDTYYDTPESRALMGEAQFLRLVRAFGAERIFFGTDSPWGGQEETLQRLRALPLEKTELDAILGGNARRLLDLPKR